MFTFNGVTASSKGIKVKDVKRDILPPVNLETLETNSDGVVVINKKFGARVIEIEIFIPPQTNLRSKVRDLATWLNSPDGTAMTLVFDDEVDKQYYAILNGETNYDQILKTGSGTLKFICPNPYAESVASTSVALTAGGTKAVTNSGTALSYPTFTVTFTAAKTNFKITNATTGEFIQINYGFVLNDSLVINCNTGTVTINGTDNRQAMTLDSTFFGLKPGALNLTCEGSATINLTYKNKWL